VDEHLDDLIRALQPGLTALRRDLHAHPELAFSERRTADVVAARLEALGVELHRGLAGTGVVATIRAGSSQRAIGLRADIDALPLEELGQPAHRSTIAGRMHGCGHDGHTAMLLGAAEALSRRRRFDGVVHVIFQPAEEGGSGARALLEQGLLERFPMEMVFGLHNWPGMPAGVIAVRPGPVMAGGDAFDITVSGRGGHAAMPHRATDTVVAGASIVLALQSLVARTVDPARPAVVSVTRFNAGSADNILPESAALGGTLRYLDPEVERSLRDGLQRVSAGVAAAHGVRAEVRLRHGYPPTVNHPAPTALARAAATAAVGCERVVVEYDATMGGEDFAFLAREVPGCYVWLGSAREPGDATLHSPYYDFNDEVIPVGVRYWVTLVEAVLAAPA
jgi:amidohydrolase